MKAAYVYEVALRGKIDVFVETPYSALDYEGTFLRDEATLQERELFRGADTAEERLLPVLDRGCDLYFARKERATVTVLRDVGEETAGGSPEIRSFFLRYPDVVGALAEGDYGLVARLAQLSRKLRPSLHLLGSIVGDRMAEAFALYWFAEGARENELERLVRGEASEDLPLARAFRLAQPYIIDESAQAYRLRAGREILDMVQAGEPLVLPVVGCNYRSWLSELADLVREARRKARIESILGGADEATAQVSIDRYLSAVEVSLVPEPCNPSDRNAVAVMIRLPGREELEHLGYLRRGLAFFLGPYLAQNGNARAKLYRLSDYGCEIRVNDALSREFDSRDSGIAV